MAYKTFVASTTLPASDLNTYLMNQSVIVCTSSTRPASPNEGMAIYETDTDKLQVYTTATTTWKPPWNLPWGRVGSAIVTTSQTGITTTTDLTGLTTTFTAVANRWYKADLLVGWDSSVNLDIAGMNIFAGATAIAYGQIRQDNVGAFQSLRIFGLFTVAAGSVTVKGTGGRAGGSGTLGTFASSTNPATLIVEDVGPSAAPA